ncbi:hypothetical protein ACJIZ3_008152 [Penstemon smallii]|uniref:Uncharacterized protein n=1 Tax=Penstemon smallii TaxID=265156 RepID=A0ABD3T9Y2_9LAMI
MKYSKFIPSISILFISLFPIILSQQPYIRQATTLCESTDNSTSVLGYTCNGLNRSCESYLTFRSAPPFNSVPTISALLSINPTQLSRLNSVSENATFETSQTVLVPVTCSCSGQYYQVNTSYIIRQNDTYFSIANNTFQGLSTCQALQGQNSNLTRNLNPGARITVPLSISSLFGVDTGRTLEANGLSEQDSNIYPFTTLLVPLQNRPVSTQVTAPQPPPPPSTTPPESVPPPSGGGSSRTWIYAVVGVVLVSIVVGGFVFFIKKKKKKKSSEPAKSFESVEKPLKKEEDDDSNDFLDSLSSIAQSLKVYTFKELKSATEDFSEKFLIKGSVYRGTINGDLAAIKKMNGDINHFNLIRLSGVCFNNGNWYLVYEYASNGPLIEWIKHESEEKILNWNQRLQIAVDIATGLNYLHRYTSPPHVHKDLNSSNVLIDRDFRAKIANFGLARSTEGQEGQFALTRHIVGTKGYMAPEYLENGIVSPKLDVYSFGVLMLEILTGKEVSLLHEEVNMQLSEVLTTVLYEDNGQENVKYMVDPLLQENYPPELALLLFKMIDNCLKKNPSDRPNMDDILQSLSRISGSTMSGEWSISISANSTTDSM